MILGAKEIYKLIKENKLAVHPLFDDAIRENLRIGGEYAVYTHSGIVVNPCKLNDSEMCRLFRTVSAFSRLRAPAGIRGGFENGGYGKI
ncbi:MAG: hypothetical protein QXT13_06460 [Pyrobaculum sp.]